MSLKSEISLEEFLLEEEWKPKFVVFPHLIEGNVVFGEPPRTHFIGFDDRASVGIGGENVNLEQRRIVDEFKVQKADALEVAVGHLRIGSIANVYGNANTLFLDESTHLYKRVCPSVGPSVTRFF